MTNEIFGDGAVVHRDDDGHILCVDYRGKYRLVSLHIDWVTGDVTRVLTSNATGRKVKYDPYGIEQLNA